MLHEEYFRIIKKKKAPNISINRGNLWKEPTDDEVYYFFIKKGFNLKKREDFIGIKHERGWIPAASFGGLCLCSTFWHMWHVNCVFSSEGESRQRFLMTFPGKRRSKHILVFSECSFIAKKRLQLWETVLLQSITSHRQLDSHRPRFYAFSCL